MSGTRKFTVQKLVDGSYVDTDQASGKRDTAISMARNLRGDERVAVQVVSPAGEVVFSMEAPTTERVIRNKTTMFTRTVNIDADEFGPGIELPEGHTPAYYRPRTKLALLRCDDRNADYTYLLFNVATGNAREFPNCTTAEAVMKQEYEVIKEQARVEREKEAAAKKAEADAKKAERDAKKAADEKAKADAKAEKEAAKAAKEAAKAEAERLEREAAEAEEAEAETDEAADKELAGASA